MAILLRQQLQMKNSLIILLLTLLGINKVIAQDIPCDDFNKITTKLESIREVDQSSRAFFIKQAAENDPLKTKELALKMKATDKENQHYVSGLLDNCGWPKGLSEDNNHTIFLVIDHADAAYMTKYFPLLKQQADLGIVAKSNLATLQDRMLLRSGFMQVYGTQTFKIGNVMYIWPIENVGTIEERRKAMGLNSMNEYIEEVKKRYSAEVSWDRTLTVAEAQQKMQRKS